MMNYSTSTLMITTLILVSIFPITLFGIYFLNDLEIQSERHELILLRETLQQEKNKIDIFFTERLADVTLSTSLPVVEDNVRGLFDENTSHVEHISKLKSIFNQILNTYNYESIWILDNDLQTVFVMGKNVGEEKPLHLPRFAEDVKQMKHGLYLSNVYPGNFGAPSELFVSKPIVIDDVQLGYIIYDIDLQTFFKETLLDLELNETGELVIVQYQNNDVFFIKELRFDNSPPFSKPLPSSSLSAIPALESTSGVSGIGLSTDYRGEEVLATWDYVPLTRWGIVAKIDTSEAFAGLHQKQTEVIILISALLITTFVVGTLLSRVYTNPLLKIKIAAHLIEKKNYAVQLIPQGPNEQKQIAESFNQMANFLKFSDNLNKKHVLDLERIDIQKGEFAAMASHELKTPLVPIKGYLEMLLESNLVGELNPKQKELLEKIYENTETMEKLVYKLLIAQRLDLGEMKWTISEFDVYDLMNEIYSDHKISMNKKKINFKNTTQRNLIVSSDYEQIKEVFSNMIVNAVDFVPDNGNIIINATSKDDSILFSIKDDGIGMSFDDQKRLFQKFYQVDTSVTRKHSGTGLGLSICKGLVEGLGGKIWVESSTGEGSTFFFTIPVKFKKDN